MKNDMYCWTSRRWLPVLRRQPLIIEPFESASMMSSRGWSRILRVDAAAEKSLFRVGGEMPERGRRNVRALRMRHGEARDERMRVAKARRQRGRRVHVAEAHVELHAIEIEGCVDAVSERRIDEIANRLAVFTFRRARCPRASE